MEIPVTGIALLIFSAFCQMSMAAQRKSYIVHMAQFDQIQETLDLEEATYFESSLESVSTTAEMLYKYRHVLHGFMVSLTPNEAKALESLPQVLSISVDTLYHLHTTRSPAFLGLDQQHTGFPSSQQVSDVIIGVFDTGVWPESESFNDTGLGPVPRSWKGVCETGVKCNKKLIGARSFFSGYEQSGSNVDLSAKSQTARDDDGHGTHTSSTAAGSVVPNANEFGYANGTAHGMATQAWVAMYKCCWSQGCFSSDIMAAMDRAIDDNVDVMSLSIGGYIEPYYNDNIAIAAFAAMRKGIFISCSAGNGGPGDSTLSNTAPWITTVGAGTLDRDFPAPIKLGNKKNYSGISLHSGKSSMGGKFLSLVYAGNATNNITHGHLCFPGTLIPSKVRGKIVLCDRGIIPRVVKGFVVKAARGAGMILANAASDGEELAADAHLCLATAVGFKAGLEIKKYLSSHPNPIATIRFQGTELEVKPAPVVAAFSSRGPNPLTPEILKPDLIAPGVNILAAWSGTGSPTGIDTDKRRVKFNIISGTSMSCPHVSGLAALVKAAHPNWSPAAIRSALMTTAYSSYENGNPLLDAATGKPSTPYAHGSGHVKPLAALDPGLVYDLNETDYFNFLCALKYTPYQIKLVSNLTTCSVHKKYSVSDLNYPSFAISVKPIPNEKSMVVTHIRKLTNVGAAGKYMVRVISPDENAVAIKVVPKTLTFSRNEILSYTVRFSVSMKMPNNTKKFGRIEWYSGNGHVVSSPIAITWVEYN